MKQKICGSYRFPINEKYGKIERFETLMNTLPFKYIKITPEDGIFLAIKKIPNVQIEFKEHLDNLKKITCFSNEGNKWRNSKIFFKEKTF